MANTVGRTQEPANRRRRVQRCLFALPVLCAALYLVLLIPDRDPPTPVGAGKSPFTWNRDAFWTELESRFVAARSAGSESIAAETTRRLQEFQRLTSLVESVELGPDAPELDQLEKAMFELAPLIAVCTEEMKNYADAIHRLRAAIKNQSRTWTLENASVRERLYRVLFGSRLTIEEVMLQLPENDPFPAITILPAGPSAGPYAEVHGVRLFSGDILVSRGGAPTSALIARGNDFPGSFSHVALLHVDEKSGDVSMIESHIESGVSIASLDQYLKDKKLRILVLRLRDDLPGIQSDPALPHSVAEASVKEAASRHIPYDFAMDYRDARSQFCSEVVSAAYGRRGIQLWKVPTHISSPVVTSWLASVGVQYFETQEPAELEFDPQVVVVAEWRDRSALLKAHVDDVVMDAMIESARAGEGLPYDRLMLPFARLAKGYSVALNWFGSVGPVPEGMSATQALRADRFRSDHDALAAQVLEKARQFKSEKGYEPPYWELLRFARDAVRKTR